MLVRRRFLHAAAASLAGAGAFGLLPARARTATRPPRIRRVIMPPSWPESAARRSGRA
ncbi:hypothetical protein RAA17_17960 [Komagataeibacter rhaeticus]|nr:hypothetical protein [Komagataeibacter rhaeticus]